MNSSEEFSDPKIAVPLPSMDCDRLPSLSADLLSLFEQAPSVQQEVRVRSPCSHPGLPVSFGSLVLSLLVSWWTKGGPGSESTLQAAIDKPLHTQQPFSLRLIPHASQRSTVSAGAGTWCSGCVAGAQALPLPDLAARERYAASLAGPADNFEFKSFGGGAAKGGGGDPGAACSCGELFLSCSSFAGPPGWVWVYDVAKSHGGMVRPRLRSGIQACGHLVWLACFVVRLCGCTALRSSFTLAGL